MESFAWLTVLGLIPLIGAVVLALGGPVRAVARPFGVIIALAGVVVSCMAWANFDTSNGGIQFAEQHAWVPQIGLHYALGVNGIGLSMIVLATILVPLCLLAMWNTVPDGDGADARRTALVALVLLMESMIVFVFAARDVLMFYIFFEAMLIPAYFLIAGFGGAKAKAAAMKFLLYGLFGGLVMLVGVITLYASQDAGTATFLTSSIEGLSLPQSTERWIFLTFFIAFALKAPMWPFHTWLPDAAEEAPPAVSVLIVGVLDKVGTFGMMTLCVVLFPETSQWAAPFIIVLALVSLIMGGLAAIGSTDMLRLIAYTSISHFGFIVMGIFAMTSTGQSGSMLYMVNHGFSTAALFLIAGFLIARRGSAKMDDFGGWQRVTPWLAGTFLMAGLSSLALPGMSSFISEFLVLNGTFERYAWAAVIGSIGLVLSATYILVLYKRTMTGPYTQKDHVKDMATREAVVVAPILAAIIALGFFPAPVLGLVTPAVEKTMSSVGVEDVPAVAEGGNH